MYIIEANAIAEADDRVAFILPSSACSALLAASEHGEVLVIQAPDVHVVAGGNARSTGLNSAIEAIGRWSAESTAFTGARCII